MYETLSVLRHDFKYYLNEIDELLQTENIEKIKLYLTEIKKRIPEGKLHFYCKDYVVNSLLASYAKNCKELNIEYKVRIALPGPLSMHSYDICVILCNLLENALEACKKLESGREIDLTIKTNEQRVMIAVKYSFDGVVIKNDFGLMSVKAIAKRYGGHVSTEQTEGVFTIYVMVNG